MLNKLRLYYVYTMSESFKPRQIVLLSKAVNKKGNELLFFLNGVSPSLSFHCVHLECILFWFLIESDFDGFTLNLILKNFSDKQDCLALEFVNISNIFINILEIFSKR